MHNVNAGDGNTPSGIFFGLFSIRTFLWLGLIAALSLLVSVACVYYSTTTQARLYADMVSMQLTGPILHESPDRRQQFIDRIEDTPGIARLHVFVDPAVSARFGLHLIDGGAANAAEAKALRTGAAGIEWLSLGAAPSVRIARPFVVNGSGDDCMQCHEAQRGAVLGGISMSYTADGMLPDVMMFVFAVGLSAGLIVLLTRRIMRMRSTPMDAFTSELSNVVRNAAQGGSAAGMARHTGRAPASPAGSASALMDSLHSSVNRITADIASLMDYDSRACNNLENACEMVSSLVGVSRFRRAIEEDRTEYDIYRRFGNLLREVFDIQRFCIYEVDVRMNRIRPALVVGEDQREDGYCDTGNLVLADACSVRRSGHALDSFASDERCPHYHRADGDGHLCMPVHRSGEVGGVLQLVVDQNERERIKPHRPILEAYLREAGAVIATKRLLGDLRESSMRDPLTGLYNRRFLSEFEKTLVASIKRRMTHAVVLMLDIDHFKQVNDTYGHEAGDSVLKELARILQASVRTSDLVIRYGGEEFMLVLMDAKVENGVWVADKIRMNIENMRIELPAGALKRTVSIGVAGFPADTDEFWKCVKFADVALYRAKESGRNRVERYADEEWEEAGGY